MHTETTTVFKSGGSQAVRIPRSFKLPDDVDEVLIYAHNDRLIIQRKRKSLHAFFEEYKDKPLSEDIVLDREGLYLRDREDLF